MIIKNFVILNVLYISTYGNELFINERKKSTWNCGEVVFAKRPRTHTIVIDTLQDHWSLNDCLSKVTESNDRIIFTGDFTPDVTTTMKMQYFIYNTPNIVIYTMNLSNVIFRNPVASLLFQSHWSIVNVVVRNNPTFACKDGNFGEEVNSSIYRFLNHFWKYYQMVYVVIEYPDDCPDTYSMYDGNKYPSQEVAQLYKRSIVTVNANDVYETLIKSDRNLTHGYPLKTNIFFRFPTSITNCDNVTSFITYNSSLTNGYCGLDALIMHDVLKISKFNVSFEMQTTTNYGYVQSGHVTGTLGLILRGELDISFNSRFMVMYSVEHSVTFLYHIWADSLCAFMKAPNEVPLWQYPFHMYGIFSWMFLIILLTFVGLMMYVKSLLFRERTLKFYVYIVNSAWSGLFGFFFNRKIKRSLLATTCLLCSVVLTAKYQGHVNYMFATLVRERTLKTFQQMCDKDIKIYTSPSIAVLLGQGSFPNNPKSTLVQRLQLYPENSSATEYALEHPNTATIERADLLLQTVLNLTDEDGRPLLYAVNECFEHYYLSYIVRPGFLFTSHLQLLMMKIVEAGLPSVYYKWTGYTLKVVDPVMKPSSEPRPTFSISIYEERIAFAVLLLGYMVSSIVFVIEFWLDKRKQHAMSGIL